MFKDSVILQYILVYTYCTVLYNVYTVFKRQHSDLRPPNGKFLCFRSAKSRKKISCDLPNINCFIIFLFAHTLSTSRFKMPSCVFRNCFKKSQLFQKDSFNAALRLFFASVLVRRQCDFKVHLTIITTTLVETVRCVKNVYLNVFDTIRTHLFLMS